MFLLLNKWWSYCGYRVTKVRRATFGPSAYFSGKCWCTAVSDPTEKWLANKSLKTVRTGTKTTVFRDCSAGRPAVPGRYTIWWRNAGNVQTRIGRDSPKFICFFKGRISVTCPNLETGLTKIIRFISRNLNKKILLFYPCEHSARCLSLSARVRRASQGPMTAATKVTKSKLSHVLILSV